MTSRNMQRTCSLVLVVIISTCLLCLVQPTLSDDVVNNENQQKTLQEAHEKKQPTVDNTKSDVAISNTSKNKTLVADDNNNNSNKENPGKTIVTSNDKSPVKVNGETTDIENLPKITESGIIHMTSLNTGALRRGFYVFVGLSVLALAYMVFRSLRLNKSRPQMVRKYGILANKQDIEMRPLPLDEDDEDDTTVFDVSGLSSQQQQSSRS